MKEKYRVIELTKGYVAVIDAEDYRRVNRHKWRMHKSAGRKKKPGQPYARSTIEGKDVYLHRFIMRCTDPLIQVDHGNHQTLDCRKTNLECVPHKINQARRRNVKRNDEISNKAQTLSRESNQGDIFVLQSL